MLSGARRDHGVARRAGGLGVPGIETSMSVPEILMVLASALLHASWSAAIKGTRSPLAFNVVQKLGMIAVGLALLPFFELGDLSPRAWAALAATGVAHGLYLWFLGESLERADLTLAYPVIRSTPAFLPFVAVPLLGESLTPIGVSGIFVVVGGIWLVHGEGGLRAVLRMPGVGFAWLTLATTVGYSLTDKAGMAALDAGAWSGPLPPALAWFALLSIAGGFVFLPIALRAVPREDLRHAFRNEWARAAGAVVIGLLGYGLILEAFRTAPASYVVAVRQTSVLFAIAIAIVLLGEHPGSRRIAGAAATVVGVALIAWGG